MGTSIQCPVFYPLKKSRRSKGEENMGDWIWDKDKNSPDGSFFFFFPLWCYQHLIPPVFHKVTVVCNWRLTQDSGVSCDDGPHPFMVTLPIIRRFFQSASCCVTCRNYLMLKQKPWLCDGCWRSQNRATSCALRSCRLYKTQLFRCVSL